MKSNLRARLSTLVLGALATATFALSACTETPGGPGGNGPNFVSDLPGSQSNGSDSGSSSSGAGGGEAQPPRSDDDEAARAIEEADIIQIKDDRLYALSQFAGLSIIDISTPSHLTLLGRHSMTGMPFEMYLRDGIVYAMFSSYWEPVYDAATLTTSWQQTSHVEALDVSDPAHIGEMGQFDLPGVISDSRMVGDVLYAVSFEDGYCWNCQDKPSTTITSIGVGDPLAIGLLDRLSYSGDDPHGYGWWRRSIAVTTERMYVAGIEWNGNGEGHSTIQIVDISDPNGQLVQGASVEVAGQIESRWQMDEKDGVLRVVSQPGVWWSNGVPRVQTFTVSSSQEITPLGSLDLTLPKPERLRSVRFDQDRVYAITAEQTDPLFTIDLTDPAHPVQRGELEMPGWIYHMEPRGDRLFALGFDNADPAGSLHVSLFDVADLDHPTMLTRVPFGGQWSMLPEDQDRIHKAFKIVDELGAIFVPYAAWKSSGDPYGCGAYESGIQIIDFTNDSLTKRGDAPASGWTRRAFLHQDKLFAVSDAELRAYDISDRDHPAALGSLPLSINVTASRVVGDVVVRLAADWWSGQARLDVVPRSDPARAEALGSLDLSSLGESACGGIGYYGTRLFHQGKLVYLVASSYAYDTGGAQSLIAVVDVTVPGAPTLRGKLTLPFDLYGGWWSGNIVSSGDNVVQLGSMLVFQRLTRTSWEQGALEQASLQIVDLSDPDAPALGTAISLPEGLGHSALITDGPLVLSSHWEPLAGDASKARFFLDRTLITGPGMALNLTSVNVPGSLAAFDHDAGNALTVDYQRVSLPVMKASDCYQVYGWDAQFQGSSWDAPGLCVGIHRSFKLAHVEGDQATLLDTAEIPDGLYLGQLLRGDDRVFGYASPSYGYAEDSAGSNGGSGPTSKVLVVAGMRAGNLQMATRELEGAYAANPVAASGTTLVLAGYSPPSIAVLDTSDLGELAYSNKGDVASYVYQVTLDGDRALCAMGPYGLAVVDLGN